MGSSGGNWPPSALGTVQVPASACIFSISSRRRINVPAATAFSTLCDTSTYPSWNTWVPNITIQSQPASNNSAEAGDSKLSSILRMGTVFTLHVIMDAAKPTKRTNTSQKVTDFSTPSQRSDYVSDQLFEASSFYPDPGQVYRIAWAMEGGWPGLKSERFHEIIIIDETECEVRTWECMGGPLALVVKWIFQTTLQGKFELWLADLKKFCEQ